MKTIELKDFIASGGADRELCRLYGETRVACQRERYEKALTGFELLYGDMEVSLFSVPGRTEMLGNHTDHNNGKVLAASVDIDIIAVAAPADEKTVRIKSEGYREDIVDLRHLDPENVCKGSSSAIIAGIGDSFIKNNYNVGGFFAYTVSDVLTGSGLSSSAAFEVMVGAIFNHFFNNGELSAIQLAKSGQYAENVFFGKPCGLMDQTACAMGGFAYIDFASSDNPVAEKLDFDISGYGYEICIVNTGGNHADLTEDYASVPLEMKSIAGYFGKKTLRSVSEETVLASIPALREGFGDRAVLRTMHFYNENKRVEAQRAAIKSKDINAFLKNTSESGSSSFKYLQNVYTVKNTDEQGLSLALALCDSMGVTARVHGGGFAGTVLAFVTSDRKESFRKLMESAFGEKCCMFLNIRPYGAVKLSL